MSIPYDTPSNALRSQIFKKANGCLLKDTRKAGGRFVCSANIVQFANIFLTYRTSVANLHLLRIELAFLTTDIFASFGVLPLLHLRAYTLQDATVYTCSYLYSGNFIISTVKSRYSHCFNCLKLFNEDRQYPKNGRFCHSEKG